MASGEPNLFAWQRIADELFVEHVCVHRAADSTPARLLAHAQQR